MVAKSPRQNADTRARSSEPTDAADPGKTKTTVQGLEGFEAQAGALTPAENVQLKGKPKAAGEKAAPAAGEAHEAGEAEAEVDPNAPEGEAGEKKEASGEGGAEAEEKEEEEEKEETGPAAEKEEEEEAEEKEEEEEEKGEKEGGEGKKRRPVGASASAKALAKHLPGEIAAEQKEAAVEGVKSDAEHEDLKTKLADAEKRLAAKKKASSAPEYTLDERHEVDELKKKIAATKAKGAEAGEKAKEAEGDLAAVEDPSASSAALKQQAAKRGSKATTASEKQTEKFGTAEDREAGRGRSVPKVLDKATGGRATKVVDHVMGHEEGKVEERSNMVGGAAVVDTKTDVKKHSIAGFDEEHAEETSIVAGDASAKHSKSSKEHLGLSGYSKDKEETHEEDTGELKSKESTKESTKINMGGYTNKKETSMQVDDHEIKSSKETAVTRGDGQIGLGRKSEKSDGIVDEEGKLVKGTKTKTDVGGFVTVKNDEVGAGAKASAERETAHGKGVTSSVSGHCGGGVTVSVKPDPDDPKFFQVIVSVKASAGVGGKLGKEGGGDDKAKVGVSVAASGSAGLTFKHRMTQEEVDAYLKDLDVVSPENAGNGTHQEFALISAAWRNGWTGDGAAKAVEAAKAAIADNPEAAKKLGKGDSVDLSLEGKVEASGEVGGNIGILEVGVKGGIEKSGKLKRTMTGGEKDTEFEVEQESEDGKSAGGSLGVAGVKGTVEFGTKDISGKGVKLKVGKEDPRYAAAYRAVMAATTQAEIEAVAARFPDVVESVSTTSGKESTEKVGMEFGGVGVEFGGAHGTKKTKTTDKDGKVEEEVSGHSKSGGALKLPGDISIGDSTDESVAVKVDAEGKATGDISQTDKKTDLEKSALEWDDKKKQGGALATATGANSKPEMKDDVRVSGMLLKDEDFDRISGMANSSDWDKKWSSTRHKADWFKLKAQLRAAKGDRKLMGEAMAAFVGSGDHERDDMLMGVVRPAGESKGGAMYEFPDGLGDLKEKYAAVVFNDPTTKVKALSEGGKAKEAREAAEAKIGELERLAVSLHSNQDKFENPASFGEMLKKINDRKAELAKYTGQDEATAARTRYNNLLGVCTDYKNQENRFLAQIESTFSEGGHVSTGDTISNVTVVNQLEALYKQWEPQYSEMASLGFTWSFDEKVFKQYKPDRERWNKAYKGQKPTEKSDEEKSSDREHERESAEMSERLFQNSPASIQARAESKQREMQSEKQQVAGQQRALVNAAFMKAANSAAWHNAATSKHRDIAPAAAQKAGDGWTKFAIGRTAKAHFEEIATSPLSVPAAIVAAAEKPIGLFAEAEALFVEGRGLNV